MRDWPPKLTPRGDAQPLDLGDGGRRLMVMRPLFILAGTLALASCVTFTGNAAPSPHRSAQIESGRAFAQDHCASCHAIGATGDSPAEAAPAFREIRDRFDARTLDGFVSQGVSFTHPAMPAFEFNKTQSKALAAYLRSVQDDARRERNAP